jgi:hypothetical protein
VSGIAAPAFLLPVWNVSGSGALTRGKPPLAGAVVSYPGAGNFPQLTTGLMPIEQAFKMALTGAAGAILHAMKSLMPAPSLAAGVWRRGRAKRVYVRRGASVSSHTLAPVGGWISLRGLGRLTRPPI